MVGVVGAQVVAQNSGGCSMGVMGAQNDNTSFQKKTAKGKISVIQIFGQGADG